MKAGFIGNRLKLTLCIRPTADREDEHAVSVVDTGPLQLTKFKTLAMQQPLPYFTERHFGKKNLQKTSLSCRKRSGAGMPYRNGWDFAIVLSCDMCSELPF